MTVSNDQNGGHKRRPNSLVDHDDFVSKKSRQSPGLLPMPPGSSGNNGLHVNKGHQQKQAMLMMTPQMMHQRREVERICLDLLKRFQHACR